MPGEDVTQLASSLYIGDTVARREVSVGNLRRHSALLWVFDARETLRSVLTNDSPGGCPYWDDEHTESLDGTLTYKFSCAADHAAASWLEVGGYVAVTDLDGQIVLFQIRQIDEVSDDTGRYYVVDAENAALELLGNYIRPSTWAGYTAEQAMQTALAGTRWQPGQVDWLGTQTLKFDQMTTVFEALQQIRAAFGGEFAFRVELQGNRIVGRYIDLLEQRGSTTLKRFEYRKDLKGVKRTVDMSQLCTAIIGQGKSDGNGAVTTFASVEWRKANGYPVDKPLGQDWVGDDDALEQYGRDGQHIFGLYVDDQQDDPRALLEAAWQELQARKQPLVTYEMDAILLERAVKSLDGDEAYEHERVRLGDTVVVRDEEFDPPLVLTARVISLTRSYSDPTRDSVVLGQFRPAFADRTTQVLLDLQARVQTVNLTDLGGQVGSTQIGSGAVGDSHIDRTSANRLQVQTADIADAAITNAKIDSIDAGKITTGTLDASKVNVINLNASNITTGTMSADKIQGGTLTLGGNNNANGSLQIKDASGKTVVTGDKNGVTVANANFLIQENGTTSVLSNRENLVRDHSFEMVPWDKTNPGDQYSTYPVQWVDPVIGSWIGAGYWDVIDNTHQQNSPNAKVYMSVAARPLYGYTAAVLDGASVACWHQYCDLDPIAKTSGPYTISVNFAAYGATTAATNGVVELWAVDDAFNRLAKVTSATAAIDPTKKLQWVRAVSTWNGTMPANTRYLEVVLYSSVSGQKILADGVQLVAAPYPVVYKPDEELFDLLRGGPYGVMPLFGGLYVNDGITSLNRNDFGYTAFHDNVDVGNHEVYGVSCLYLGGTINVGSPRTPVYLAPPSPYAVGMDQYGNLQPINPAAINSGNIWNVFDKNSNAVLQVYVDGTKQVKINGSYTATGSKSAVVTDSQGNDLYLYTLESPEVRFEDFGEATTDANGQAVVNLDATFLETVDTSDCKYHVQITGVNGTGFSVPTRTATSFTVQGPPNATFMWRVSAWRKGYAGLRFNAAQQVQ